MEDGEGRQRWSKAKEHLGNLFTGCCGSTWASERHNTNHKDKAQLAQGQDTHRFHGPGPRISNLTLADALGGHFEMEPTERAVQKPLISLMEEMDRADQATERSRSSGRRIGGVCRVCMDRVRDAVFIPCGHAFCRVCSRELWINNRHCPFCDHSECSAVRKKEMETDETRPTNSENENGTCPSHQLKSGPYAFDF
ncbi:hypothetical protein Ancab_008079 [Ancistrocladus abbreviatus]